MDWTEIIKLLLTATVPSVLTYVATKKQCDSKIKEITISKDAEIKQLTLTHQHEIEKLHLEHQLQKDNKSDDITTDLTLKFLSGELDLPKILSNMNQLRDLQQQADKLKSKNDMSQFIKEK